MPLSVTYTFQQPCAPSPFSEGTYVLKLTGSGGPRVTDDELLSGLFLTGVLSTKDKQNCHVLHPADQFERLLWLGAGYDNTSLLDRATLTVQCAAAEEGKRDVHIRVYDSRKPPSCFTIDWIPTTVTRAQVEELVSSFCVIDRLSQDSQNPLKYFVNTFTSADEIPHWIYVPNMIESEVNDDSPRALRVSVKGRLEMCRYCSATNHPWFHCPQNKKQKKIKKKKPKTNNEKNKTQPKQTQQQPNQQQQSQPETNKDKQTETNTQQRKQGLLPLPHPPTPLKPVQSSKLSTFNSPNKRKLELDKSKDQATKQLKKLMAKEIPRDGEDESAGKEAISLSPIQGSNPPSPVFFDASSFEPSSQNDDKNLEIIPIIEESENNEYDFPIGPARNKAFYTNVRHDPAFKEAKKDKLAYLHLEAIQERLIKLSKDCTGKPTYNKPTKKKIIDAEHQILEQTKKEWQQSANYLIYLYNWSKHYKFLNENSKKSFLERFSNFV